MENGQFGKMPSAPKKTLSVKQKCVLKKVIIMYYMIPTYRINVQDAVLLHIIQAG